MNFKGRGAIHFLLYFLIVPPKIVETEKGAVHLLLFWIIVSSPKKYYRYSTRGTINL